MLIDQPLLAALYCCCTCPVFGLGLPTFSAMVDIRGAAGGRHPAAAKHPLFLLIVCTRYK